MEHQLGAAKSTQSIKKTGVTELGITVVVIITFIVIIIVIVVVMIVIVVVIIIIKHCRLVSR